jgi:hypothetical protein
MRAPFLTVVVPQFLQEQKRIQEVVHALQDVVPEDAVSSPRSTPNTH